jgi:NAD(P)H-quinone oxidoreductase subunit 4L
MSSRSRIVTALFVLACTVAVCAYAYIMRLAPDAQAALETRLFLPSDVALSAAVAVATVLALLAGGQRSIVAIVATIAIFLVLTLSQSMPIRYMSLAAILFCMGFYGMVASRNAVRVLISIELMLNAVNINFVTMARFVDPATIKGQVFAIFILAVAAAEAAVGLAIVLALYRNNSTVDMEKFGNLRG